ncbi:MAG: DUF4351 domain-containing protein [Planctomycetes bacterium]|nr:DUF4351 domain-containing protein [Planctomycetota bacterium]
MSSRAVDAATLLTLLALKHARTATDLRERLLDWVSLMGAVARAPGGRAVLLLVLRNLVLVNQRIGREFVLNQLGPRFEDSVAKEAVMTWLEELIAEGRDLGQRDLLLKQLRRRFGELPAEPIDRVRQAPLDRVEEWGLRIFEARTLAEALAD